MKICIIGGSTAGWWSAGYLEKHMPEAELVIYDSPKIPPLGVGESTLPQIKTWFDELGIKEEDWIDDSNAVKKYGNWKQGWDNPIGDPMILSFWYDMGKFESLMKDPQNWNYVSGKDRTPKKNNFYDVFETNYDYAYHVCAESSANMFKNLCERTEIRYETLEKLPSGFDLYLDCTGFNRAFVKDFTKMPISKYHYVDSAWVCPMEKNDECNNVTKSIARRYGWQFQVDLQNRTGMGYIFSGRHVHKDDALLEFREMFGDFDPGWWHENQIETFCKRTPITEPRYLQWEPMVLANPWSDNVVALGSAAGFVDPLEATALFNLQSGIINLVKCLKRNLPPKVYNRQMRNIWNDSLRFQECHYTLSEREDTAFWRDITKERPKYKKLIWNYYDRYNSEFQNIFPSGVYAQQIIYLNAYNERYYA